MKCIRFIQLIINKLLIEPIMSTLSPEQKYAFAKFKLGENLFITGPGGTGKTKLIETLVDHAKTEGKVIQVCAMTGCASVLLKCDAQTLHSWSGIRLGKGPSNIIIKNVLKNKKQCQNWRKTQILIVDEVSMMSYKILELIEELARSARKNAAPFGGMQVIFTGDFFQLPPVGTAGDPATELFCFESPLWRQIFPPAQCIQLCTIFRQTDPQYKEILSQIRTASLTPENAAILKTRVKCEFNADAHNGCIPIKLYPTRAKTDYFNKLMFNKLDGKEEIFECIKKRDCTTHLNNNKALSLADIERCQYLSLQEIEYEWQQLLTNGGSSEESIVLKIGASVICTANLDMDNGICNGAQGIIVDIIENKATLITPSEKYIPVVKFANGITRPIAFHYRQSDEYPAIAVGQIPLCLAWALTIHKIQGATLAMADIDVGFQIFECGQTYVALSRVQSLDGLYLSAFNPQCIRANERVKAFYASLPKVDYTVDLAKADPFTQFAYVDPTIKKIKL